LAANFLSFDCTCTWLSQLIGDILDPSPDGSPSETMGILDELH
jgi:hypothetical protein